MENIWTPVLRGYVSSLTVCTVSGDGKKTVLPFIDPTLSAQTMFFYYFPRAKGVIYLEGTQ